MKEFICIVCPIGCHLEVNEETLEVKGNGCPRGITYGQKECVKPMRHITSTVKVIQGERPVVSVKTKDEIPKDMIFIVMEEIKKASLEAPVQIGDVVISNVCDLGVDIVATSTVRKLFK